MLTSDGKGVCAVQGDRGGESRRTLGLDKRGRGKYSGRPTALLTNLSAQLRNSIQAGCFQSKVLGHWGMLLRPKVRALMPTLHSAWQLAAKCNRWGAAGRVNYLQVTWPSGTNRRPGSATCRSHDQVELLGRRKKELPEAGHMT
jgi:hypothetical protein